MNQPPTELLRLLGLKVTPWAGERWPVGRSYDDFAQVAGELEEAFPAGSSGEEKIVGFSEEYSLVVKIPGNPDHQDWEAGMQSIFEEYHASRWGLAGHFVMAKSYLYRHESGVPLLVQERLENLTTKVSEELGKALPWLPKSWWSYAQIGQRRNGDWRIYDLDAGSSCDFYPEREADGFMDELTRSYYEGASR